MKDDNYIVILGWMRKDLELKGTDLLVYATIHGFSQDGASYFTGSASYLAEWTGLTTKSIYTALASLVDRGLLDKKEIVLSNMKACHYRTITKKGGTEKESEGKKNIPNPLGKNFSTPRKKLPNPTEKTSHYITNYNTSNITNNKEEKEENSRPLAVPPNNDLDKLKLSTRESIKAINPTAFEVNPPREHKANQELCKTVIRLANGDHLPLMAEILNTYKKLKSGKDKFWREAPWTASGIFARLTQVLEAMRGSDRLSEGELRELDRQAKEIPF